MTLYQHERVGLRTYAILIDENIVTQEFSKHERIVHALGLERVQRLISCYEPTMPVGEFIYDTINGVHYKSAHFRGIRNHIKRVFKIGAK